MDVMKRQEGEMVEREGDSVKDDGPECAAKLCDLEIQVCVIKDNDGFYHHHLPGMARQGMRFSAAIHAGGMSC